MRNKSNNKNYVTNLDASPVLECFSANVLNTALVRELETPARVVVGHMIQSVSKDGKAHLSSNNGHAWSEIRDGSKRIRFDATPTNKENGESSEQNMDDQEKDSNQNKSADGNMDD
ncbi:transglutaminase domain-containing protein [Patescibacteria group bacterium]|nr:transglutaminase domain-containing protein [Patescibacteria group bacterium]